MIDGIVRVDILFLIDSEGRVCNYVEELPFSCSVDVEGAK